ncbi:MAG: ankyrin repeat domain-containing protein [Cyclobacteriaceae bacterium]|nr:ankyrin repeat domain-containing protein [Cyclobacteriaceae bacterium]
MKKHFNLKMVTGLAVLILLPHLSVFAGPNEDLFSACKSGNLSGVESALKAGADANAIDASGNSVLANAFFWPEITKLLLSKGANPNGGKYPAIIQAANNYSVEVMDLLLAAGADPNAPGEIASPAMKAVYDQIKNLEDQAKSAKGKSKKIFEDAVANLKAQYGDGTTGGVKVYAINQAVQQSNCAPCIEKLLTKGAKMDLAAGQPLIHIWASFAMTAAERKDAFAKGKAVIEGTYGIKTPDWYGNLPSDRNKESEDILRLLIVAGSDVNQLNAQGKTPLHVALAGGIGVKDHAMTALLKNGADISIEDPEFGKCFTMAARTGLVEVAKLMVSKGADIGETSKIMDMTQGQRLNGATPLIAATINNHLDMVKYLVAIGASIKEDAEGFSYNIYTGCATGVKNKSAIYFAVDNRNMDIIKFMVEESGLKWYRPMKINQLKQEFVSQAGNLKITTTKCYSDGEYKPSAYAKKMELKDIAGYLKDHDL